MSTITNDIEVVLAQLQQEKIVAIPTETVYGLAGNAKSDVAIKKIYAMKQRPLNHPIIMHVTKNSDLFQWVSYIPEYAIQLMKYFWPGSLTLVFRANLNYVNPLITACQDTIAIRCPKHSLTLQLLEQLGSPIVAPSANMFGKISPTTALHVQQSFQNADLLILDGGRCEIGIESTIVLATNPDSYQILRPGIIDETDINAVINIQTTNNHSEYMSSKNLNNVKVPGKLASHYQPDKPLYCFNTIQEIENFCQNNKASVYILSFTNIKEQSKLFITHGFNNKLYYLLPNSAKAAAFELYYQLRLADESIADCIVIELPARNEQWNGVRERILKASVH